MDVALHPRFAENRLVYLTYTKPVENGRGTPALARGRLDGATLTEVRDLVVPEAYDGNSGLNGRLVFGRDGMVYMSTGGNIRDIAQNPASLRGKILRLRDDGSVPDDNPFAGRAGYRPEIFTLGHRNTLALIVHPETGVIWNNENGPNGGDEINIILPGTKLRMAARELRARLSGAARLRAPDARGHGIAARRRGFRPSPWPAWRSTPAIASPHWKGNVFVGAMRMGLIPGTGHLQRIVFNARTEEMRRESLLTELRQRIRDVRQGPDGLLYLLTDEDDGALLRIEPVP